MHLCNTKDNHYVPVFYLSKFLDADARTHMLDKKKGVIHSTSDLRTIAFKTNLYTIKNKISENDVSCFKKMFKIKEDDLITNTTIKLIVPFLNDELGFLISIKSKSEEKKEIIEKIGKEFKDSLCEKEISRNQELLFCEYENAFRPIYDAILTDGKISLSCDNSISAIPYLASKMALYVYESVPKKIVMMKKNVPEIKAEFCRISSKIRADVPKNQYYDLINYIVIQHLRTLKIWGAFNINSENFKKYGVNSDSLRFLFVHCHSLAIVDNLIKDNYKLILIKNKTQTPFITTDNPTRNTYVSFAEDRKLECDELEFYFPLTPDMAILYSKRACYSETDEIEITNEAGIEPFNMLLFDGAESYVYSNSKTYLENLLKFL